MAGVADSIKCVAVFNGNVYVVTLSSVKIYTTSGTFESEFEIEGTAEDVVIV